MGGLRGLGAAPLGADGDGGLTLEDIRQYRRLRQLPLHPLIAQGYPSIGCAPCTRPVRKGEDQRAGRWSQLDKAECGIHRCEDI